MTIAAPLIERHFDFGTAASPLAPGYTRITEATKYSAALGYGWVSGTIQSRDRGGTVGPLKQDLCFGNNITFGVDVPNGNYNVTLLIGDTASRHDQIGVFIEGAQVDLVADLPGGTFYNQTFPVTVTDGQLTVNLKDMGGVDGSVVINALDVVQNVPQPLDIPAQTFPDAMVGLTYSVQIVATGGSGQYLFAVVSGLPPGLSLSQTGLLAGIPTQAGVFSFNFSVSDMGNTLAIKFGTSLLTVSANPPGVPTNLEAVAGSLTVVNVTWSPSPNHEATYILYRSPDGVTYTQIATTNNTVYGYPDNIDSTVEHWYKLIARNHFGDSDAIVFHYTPAGTAPNAPSGLTATAHGTSQIDLSWTDNADNETGFKIERSPAGAGTWAEIDTTTTNLTTYQNTGLAAGTSYDYRVRAYNANGNSAYSNTATATTDSNPASPPAAPSNPTATALNSHAIRVGWTDNSTDETGFEVHWSDTELGTYVLLVTTNANLQQYDNDGLSPQQTRWYKIRAVNGAGASAFTTAVSATTPTAAVHVLPDLVASAVLKATNNTAQFQTFKNTWYTDAKFNALNVGAYEGGHLPPLACFALGYQMFKTSDPTLATKCGHKTVSLLISAVREFLSSVAANQVGYQYLARGDGVTTVFTLPDAPISTFSVKLVTLNHQAVVRSATLNYDTVANYSHFLKVSNTSDGTADYVEDTDWRHGKLSLATNQQIDWGIGGSKPANGATYYVTHAVLNGVNALATNQYTRVGTTLTFNTAPTAQQAIFVQYVYGTSYRQTLSTGGGMCSAYVDVGFPTRYMQYAAAAYDWIYDFSGFDQATKTEVEDVFISWATRAFSGAYQAGNLQSNYGAGHYNCLCAMAVALEGTRAEAATILNNALTVRNAAVDRDLRDAAGSHINATYKGGFYGEGWSYGGGSTRLVTVASDYLAQAGHLDNTKEKAWAAEVTRAIIHGQPDLHHIYNACDWNTYLTADTPTRNDMVVTGLTTDDAETRAFINHWATVSGGLFDDSTVFKFLYYDPTATATNWAATEPLGYLAEGTGLLMSRAAWDYASSFGTFQAGNPALAGHQCVNVSQVQIWRGVDDLLIFAAQKAGTQNNQYKSRYGNQITIDDGGAGQQLYPFAQKTGDYGPVPGVTITKSAITAAYSYAIADCTKAWYKDATHNPCTEVFRTFLHVRPDYFFIYDRITTKAASYVKRFQLWANNAFTLVGSTGFKTSKGTSNLYGQVYSNRPITATATITLVLSTNIPQFYVDPTTPDDVAIRYATVMQPTATAVAAIDSNEYVTSASYEGIRIGNVVAMFANSATPVTPLSYSYTAPAGTMTHYVCDLTPSTQYTLSGSASGTATTNSAGVLTFTTPGGGAETVTIT